MNREEILKKSQQENQGKPDEREVSAYGKSSKVGMAVGGIICALLYFVSELTETRELGLASWVVYFSMQGSSNIVLYFTLKQRNKLIQGIVYTFFSIGFAAALIVYIYGIKNG